MEQRCRAETDTTHYLSSCLRHEHKVLVIVGNEQVIEDLNWHHRSHICHYQGLSGKGAPHLFFSINSTVQGSGGETLKILLPVNSISEQSKYNFGAKTDFVALFLDFIYMNVVVSYWVSKDITARH